MYTRNELIKLHRKFSHPAIDKLLNLLKLAKPWEVDEKTKSVLEDIAHQCNPCQRIRSGPI